MKEKAVKEQQRKRNGRNRLQIRLCACTYSIKNLQDASYKRVSPSQHRITNSHLERVVLLLSPLKYRPTDSEDESLYNKDQRGLASQGW
jgi:hypothetical protein